MHVSLKKNEEDAMLTATHTDLKPFEDLAASFAAKELAKKTEEHDTYPFGPFFTKVLDKAYEVGFLGVLLPEDLGGINGGISALCVILDNICRADSSLGGIIFTNALAQQIMMEARADKALKKIFPKASGAREFLVACPSFCNPAQMVKLPTAERSGKGYVLKGDLEYLVLGNIAANALIPARVEGKPGLSFFLVDLGGKSVKKGEPIFSLGLHACPAVDVTFEDAGARLVGEEGSGYALFQEVSGKLHVAAAAMSAGILKGSFSAALAYSRERFQGGCQIINWSEVSMILANMAVKADVADLCVAQACQALEAGVRDRGRFAVSAAVHVHELCCEAVNDGVQVLGGNGYMKDYGQEKRYRDARQVQALLGISPMKKVSIIRQIAGLEDTCAAAF